MKKNSRQIADALVALHNEYARRYRKELAKLGYTRIDVYPTLRHALDLYDATNAEFMAADIAPEGHKAGTTVKRYVELVHGHAPMPGFKGAGKTPASIKAIREAYQRELDALIEGIEA